MVALTDLQVGQLAEGQPFQRRVSASIMIKASYIVDVCRTTGTFEEPIEGQTPVFSVAQLRAAISIMRSETPMSKYYLPMAASGNIRTVDPVLDGNGVAVDTSASDGALDAQMYSTVFQTIF